MNEWSASAYISIRAFFVLSYAPAAESAPSDWHRQHLQTAPSSPSTAVFHACIFICGWECRWWYMCLGCLPACACQADSTINTWMWFWRVLNNTASNDEARGISLNHYTHGQCWSGKLQCVKRLKCWASMHSLVCPWWWYGGCAHPFWTTLRLLIRCITHTYTEREKDSTPFHWMSKCKTDGNADFVLRRVTDGMISLSKSLSIIFRVQPTK